MGFVRFIFIVLVVSFPAFSHQLWMERKEDSLVLYYGHLNPEKGEQEKIPYSLDNLKKVECYKGSGSFSVSINRIPLAVEEECDFVFVEFSTGYWTKTTEGTVHFPKNRVTNPIYSWLSVENLVYLVRWDRKILGNVFKGLVILPVKNPLSLKSGDKVRLVVLLDGKPVADAPVSYDGKLRGTTDSKGRINIRIRHPGLQIIEASVRQKVSSEKADYVIYSATLNFEVR